MSSTNTSLAAMGFMGLACAQVLGITDGEPRSDVGTGGTPASGGANGSGGGSGTSAGGSSSGGMGGQIGTGGNEQVSYSDIADANQWQTFVLNGVTGISGNFSGGTFDGRFVYFSPHSSAAVLRYDTTASFVNRNSWLAFNVASVPEITANRYQGGVLLAGSRIQFVPNNNGATPYGYTISYDTEAAFEDGTSWSGIGLGGEQAGAVGYMGSAFDGKYVYYAPNHLRTDTTVDPVTGATSSTPVFHGLVARYDSELPFNEGTSWRFYNAAAVDPSSVGFHGAVHANQYVYFMPYRRAGGAANSTATRYDTRVAFDAPTSWTTFDISTKSPSAKGFIGGVFDGRYVYYVPHHDPADAATPYHGLVVRYDTTRSFTTGTSWSVFDMEEVDPLAKGFLGGAFDGRYVYFVPHNANTSGVVVRYDTEAVFDSVDSWEPFDLTTLNASAKGFWGAVFDGEYLYLIPEINGVVARFRARSPRATTLPYNGGSFF